MFGNKERHGGYLKRLKIMNKEGPGEIFILSNPTFPPFSKGDKK